MSRDFKHILLWVVAIFIVLMSVNYLAGAAIDLADHVADQMQSTSTPVY